MTQKPAPTLPTKKPPGRPWKRFLFIIALFLFTIIYNLPRTEVNWKIAGQEIKTIGGYPLFQHPMDLKLGLDLQGGVQLTLQAKMDNIAPADRQSALDSARVIIERRVNSFGVSEPIVQSAKVGDNYRILVELAGLQDVNEAVKLVGTTAQLEFREPLGPEETATLRQSIRQELIATNPELAVTPAPSPSGSPDPSASPAFDNAAFLNQLEELMLQQRAFKENSDLTGKDLKRADVAFGGTQAAGATVSITFNDDGARKFAELTQKYVGQPIGIFLDNQMVSAPVVNEPIFGGQATISGNFTSKSAKELATQLNAGALPVPIEIVEQRTVGASLGQQSVESSVKAGLVGLGVIALYMILFYRGKGVISAVALVLYTLISLTLFRYIPVTLTLAGVAGFILSIGMAIDANISTFERIKEELKWGKSKSAALRLGFDRAWSSIRDSNISSLLTCAILYYFGTGIIKGFAVTLALGILVSLFTAISVTKILLAVFSKSKI